MEFDELMKTIIKDYQVSALENRIRDQDLYARRECERILSSYLRAPARKQGAEYQRMRSRMDEEYDSGLATLRGRGETPLWRVFKRKDLERDALDRRDTLQRLTVEAEHQMHRFDDIASFCYRNGALSLEATRARAYEAVWKHGLTLLLLFDDAYLGNLSTIEVIPELPETTPRWTF